ncbi:hypothetical protein EV127DRAFT_106483 [Xylaria flabelliformis]|nr:hypothetical protein EV127DRAFT_106483 [Xylaria flabelliformis]
MEPHNGPDGPPPPYSETDIYSHSHGSRNRPSSRADDDVSIAPSSSNSNIIFTPPESPREAQFNFAGPSSDQHTTTSAQAYFDSRPPNRPPGLSITIDLEITPGATPSDFPYPKRALDRDITEQDWQTFINYLIPEHVARVNSHIVDRKLRATETAQPSANDDIAEAQLAPLKSSANVSPQDIEAVTREWNVGFFEPRGVTIRPKFPAESAAEEAQIPENEASRTASADAEQGQSQPQQQSGGWWRQQPGSWWRNPFGYVDGNNGSLRIGPLHIEGDRVALGSTFEADRDGVRWGGGPNAHPLFEASSRGVRWGEQPGPTPGHPHPLDLRGGHSWAGPFGGRGRGRGREHGPGRRDHSRSSTSSSSSHSSSDSDSSVGSLPDWDDLKDTQLPVTKRSVQAWLSHPDQPVTKDMLKQAKAEIKAAKSTPPPPRDPSWDQARESLRREVKDLLQQFKVLKRQQRNAKRATRRERRQQRRAARQERRERRRAERQDRRGDRGTRRAERDADRHARRHRHHHPVPPVPPMPAGSTVPPTPPAPNAFPTPPPFPGGFGGFFGRGSFGRGSFGPQPSPSPPSFGFGRGFGRGRGRGHDRGWDPAHAAHDATEQAHRAAAEARTAAEREVAEALAAAAQERENALAQAERERRKAAEVAEESRRAAIEAVQRSRAHAGIARYNALSAAAEQRRAAAAVAAEETRRAATEAASRVAVDTKLAEARALESQISAKAGQIQALEENLGRDDQKEEKKKDGGSDKLRAIEQLEREMELLGRKVETLRVEADEEFARRLAQREDDWGEWH